MKKENLKKCGCFICGGKGEVNDAVDASPYGEVFFADVQCKNCEGEGSLFPNSAMDEYAKQEAIAFEKWRYDELWFQNVTGGYLKHLGNGNTTDIITTEQLYELFKQTHK